MKRLISGMEAVQAGLVPLIPRLECAMPAVERLPHADVYRLWRSLPGYRKACRMLRRSGRRIRGQREREMQARLAPIRDLRNRLDATEVEDLLLMLPDDAARRDVFERLPINSEVRAILDRRRSVYPAETVRAIWGGVLDAPATFANITPAAYLDWEANGSKTKPFTRADFERSVEKLTK